MYNNFVSTSIKTLWYDDISMKLIVQYANTSQYTYDGVSPIEWQNLKLAQSKGKFISQNIKSKPYQKRILNG